MSMVRGRGTFFGILGMPFWTLFSSNQKAMLGTGRVHGSEPSGTSWQGVRCGRGAFFSILGMPFLDLVFFKSESNVRHRPCPWFGAFGHLLARRSGVVGARFLASWGCHSGPCFVRTRKQRLEWPRPWLGAFGHLLARCSGVVGARFLASWGCHSGPCFLRVRKQR